MVRRLALTTLLAFAACASPYAATDPPAQTPPGADGGSQPPPGDGGSDVAPAPIDGATTDGAVPKTCDPASSFGMPIRIDGNVSGADEDSDAKLAESELSITFTSDRGAVPKKSRIYGATRPSTSSAWGMPSVLLEGVDVLFDASFAPNALHVVYQRGGKTAGARIVVGRRATAAETFSEKELAVPRTPGQDERDPFVVFGMADVTSYAVLYSQNGATANRDLYMANVDDADNVLSSAAMTELNTPGNERDPVMSKDGLEIFFASDRAQAGVMRIYHATRMPGASKAFGNPELLLELAGAATNAYEAPTWLSANRCVLYFSSDRSGTTDIWRAVRSP